jgi:PAS domain S-box-containing protein
MAVLGRCRTLSGQRASRSCGILCVLLAVQWLGPSLYANDGRYRVLMLHAFNFNFPATTRIADAARQRLMEISPREIEFDADFLDLARVADPEHERRTAEFLRQKHARTPPDVVMTLGSAALPFILKYRDVIAPNIPVVFTSISAHNYAAQRLPPDVTGIISEFNLDKTLQLAERLQPDARQLFIIAGSGPTDRLWYAKARSVVESRAPKFEATFLFGLPYEKLVAELSRVSPDAIVILLTVFADSQGKSFIPADVAKSLSALSPAPLYAPYETYLGQGSVGGFVETFESVGMAAADLMLEVLAGNDPKTLPPRTNRAQAYRVDLRAMNRWNLPEDRLPPGTTVLFKRPSIWEQHYHLVLAAFFAFALQTLFAAALLVQWQRKLRAERLLKESEERITFAAASANIGLWQFDSRSNELWATEHCRALFGLDEKLPLTHETVLSMVHPEDRRLAIAALRDAPQGTGGVGGEVRIVLLDGQTRWIRVRAHPHSDDRGSIHLLSGVFIDITEQKMAEAEARLQREEVTHLVRVSTLGELSGAIAHEISQPLTAILANAQAALHLMRQETPDLTEVERALEEVVHEDNRAGEVIQRLRKLLRRGERRSERIDMNELVRSTLALLNSELISRRITVKTDLQEGLPETLGDPVQLQQVLLNLLMNAMDAMGGTPVSQRFIVIATRVDRARGLEVLVKDRGVGIRLAERARLFEPFYTTKSHGLGLGLSICSTIVQAHGGKLALSNNEEGGGTAASLSLPAQKVLLAAE